MILGMNLSTWLEKERGRTVALAAALQIPGSMVSNMAAGKKPIPLVHCPAIEQFTGGAVTCEDLRPDKADYFALIRSQKRPPALANAAQCAINSVAAGAAQGV